MSNTLKDTVAAAKAIHSFVDDINRYHFTIDDINDIAFFRPDIIDTISVVRELLSFYNGNIDDIDDVDAKPEDVISDDEPAISDESTTNNEDGIITVPEKRHNQSVDYNNLGYYISKYLNNTPLNDAKRSLYEKYPEINRLNINRFLNKKTNVKVSDKYFSVNEGIVHAVDGYPVPSYDSKASNIIKEYAKDSEQFFKMIGSMPEEIWNPGLVLMTEEEGSVERIYRKADPKPTTSMLINYETIKRAMYYAGINTTAKLDLFDMTVIISHAISKIGKKKISRISNFIKKTWNVTVRPEQIYSVINKKEYPEISDLFFK